MWRLNTVGCGNPKVRYLKLPGPVEEKMKSPPQPRRAHSHPKTERENVSIKKKKKTFSNKESLQSPWPKEPLKTVLQCRGT